MNFVCFRFQRTEKMDSAMKELMGQCPSPQNFWARTAPACPTGLVHPLASPLTKSWCRHYALSQPPAEAVITLAKQMGMRCCTNSSSSSSSSSCTNRRRGFSVCMASVNYKLIVYVAAVFFDHVDQRLRSRQRI